jgi:hypothetical protein
MKNQDKKKMVRVEMFQQDENTFLSFRRLITTAQAGQIMAYIAGLPNTIPLKAKKKKI